MTVVETLLVFVGAPLAVVLALALLTYLPGGRKRRPRYKPGQPWDHPPVWYEPHPEHEAAGGHDGGRPEAQSIGSSLFPEHQAIEAPSHGASPAGGARQPVPAGPLGGARGTW